MDRITWDPEKDRLNQAKHGILFAEAALVLAGDPVRNWSLVRKDTASARHVVASGPELAELARPFMPERTPEEAAALAPFLAALRRITGPLDADPEIKDERVY